MSKGITIGNVGLIISILVLILISLSCHVMNYLFPRNLDKFVNDSNGCSSKCPGRYAKIDYYYPKPNEICTSNEEAQVPCFVTDKCTNRELTDDQKALLYRVMYNRSGLEIMKRALDNPDTF